MAELSNYELRQLTAAVIRQAIKDSTTGRDLAAQEWLFTHGQEWAQVLRVGINFNGIRKAITQGDIKSRQLKRMNE